MATVKQNGTPVWYLWRRTKATASRRSSNADFQFYATVAFIQAHLLN